MINAVVPVPTVLFVLPLVALVVYLWWLAMNKLLSLLQPWIQIQFLKRNWRDMVAGGFKTGPFPMPDVTVPTEQFGNWPLVSRFFCWVELNRRREQELLRGEFQWLVEQQLEYEARFEVYQKKFAKGDHTPPFTQS